MKFLASGEFGAGGSSIRVKLGSETSVFEIKPIFAFILSAMAGVAASRNLAAAGALAASYLCRAQWIKRPFARVVQTDPGDIAIVRALESQLSGCLG